MAQTVQSISPVFVEGTKKQYNASASISVNSEKPEAEDNLSLILSLCESINECCISLLRLYRKAVMINNELKTEDGGIDE